MDNLNLVAKKISDVVINNVLSDEENIWAGDTFYGPMVCWDGDELSIAIQNQVEDILREEHAFGNLS